MAKRNIKLFRLLDLNHNKKEERRKLDCDAIIKEVQDDPSVADVEYNFSHGYGLETTYYPLHKAIMLYAPIHVINALCSDKALSAKSSMGNNALALTFKYKSSWTIVKLLLEKRPDIAREKIGSDTPLHIACKMNLHFEVLSMLLSVWPDAIKEKNCCGDTPLHRACNRKVSLELASLVLSAWPGALREKNYLGYTPLISACLLNARLDVVSLIISAWPNALHEKSNDGITPLHMACLASTLEVLSLLLNRWPGAVREKTVSGNTPLHYAVRGGPRSMEVITLLLDKWPGVIKERNNSGRSPLNEAYVYNAPKDIKDLLMKLSFLYDDDMKDPSSNEIMSHFSYIEWWNGVSLVLDRHPSVSRDLSLQTNCVPSFLSMVGRCCKLKTMWEVIRDEQDLFSCI